jgi:hypothetical protein
MLEDGKQEDSGSPIDMCPSCGRAVALGSLRATVPLVAEWPPLHSNLEEQTIGGAF